MSDSLRPAVEATVGHVEDLTRRIGATSPQIEATITRLDVLTRMVEMILSENRENLKLTLASVKDLTGSANEIVTVNRPKVEHVIEGVDMLTARTNRVMYQADVLASQGVQIMTKGRSEIERSISNVRDATDWADKLVQKIYTNPFVLSPFYKPSNEDLRVQTVYDTAQVFSKGAQELHDAAKTLDAMQARTEPRPSNGRRSPGSSNRCLGSTESLGKTSQSWPRD